jgi:branched-chain amino acid transport system ATP-binding protein
MLQVEALHVAYGAVRALRGVSLEVNAGEVVALIGANGAGKSTLLRTISGILKPTSGEVQFEGRTLKGVAEDKIVRLGILQVQEGRGILTRMTVLENLEMGAYGRSNKAEIRRDLEMVFDKFPVLRERQRQFGATLSGGEQQMLAIGRALMARPKLLMLDEPSLGLAPMLVQEIFRIIRDFKREKRTILLVEQNARKALQCADRAYVLETGAIVLSGSGETLLKSEAVQAAYLGGHAEVDRFSKGNRGT